MFRERRFYSNVTTLLFVVIGFSLVAVTFGVIARSADAIAGGIGLAAFLSLVTLGARWLWPVYAGSDGLRTYDGIGVFRDLPWADIKDVSRTLGYYWIKTHSGKTLTVPTYLEDQAGFHRYVLVNAPADNPLRKAIQSLPSSMAH